MLFNTYLRYTWLQANNANDNNSDLYLERCELECDIIPRG